MLSKKLFVTSVILIITQYSFTMELPSNSSSNFKCAWGVSLRQAKRKTMEDVYKVELPFFISGSTEPAGFFAIYDGHGGKEAAQLASEILHHKLQAALQKQMPVQEALKTAFIETNTEICAKAKYEYQGTTATVVYLQENSCHIAWVGDSRALVISPNGTIKYATRDHTPQDPEEAKRLELAGGILEKGTVWRIHGLSISRALGDFYSKRSNSLLVIAEPEVHTLTLEDNDIILIASDGFWYFFDNKTTASRVKLLLDPEYPCTFVNNITTLVSPTEENSEQGNDDCCINAAHILREYAFDQGKGYTTSDNISVLVIQRKQPEEAPPSQHSTEIDEDSMNEEQNLNHESPSPS